MLGKRASSLSARFLATPAGARAGEADEFRHLTQGGHVGLRQRGAEPAEGRLDLLDIAPVEATDVGISHAPLVILTSLLLEHRLRCRLGIVRTDPAEVLLFTVVLGDEAQTEGSVVDRELEEPVHVGVVGVAPDVEPALELRRGSPRDRAIHRTMLSYGDSGNGSAYATITRAWRRPCCAPVSTFSMRRARTTSVVLLTALSWSRFGSTRRRSALSARIRASRGCGSSPGPRPSVQPR